MSTPSAIRIALHVLLHAILHAKHTSQRGKRISGDTHCLQKNEKSPKSRTEQFAAVAERRGKSRRNTEKTGSRSKNRGPAKKRKVK